jgi:starch synthase
MKILIATPEAIPFAKTGGLADVTGALLNEYKRMKKEAYLILPLYRKIKENFKLRDKNLKVKVSLADRSLTGRIFENASTYFIECDELFDRDDLYGTPHGDYPDNASRFIFFSRAILEACKALRLKPDIIHCNDWQTGLVPLYLKTLYRTDKLFSKTSSVLTVHNLGYQGLFPASEIPSLGLGWAVFHPEGIEFYGKINFLKAGLITADSVTTVSNNYAKEMLTPEYGFGLDGVLRKKSSLIRGIINGIDYKEWNPATDRFIAKNYSVEDITGKQRCKLHLLKECGMKTDVKVPLMGIVGRLSSQKGIDLVLESMEDILSTGANLIILGKGDDIFHAGLSRAAERHKGRVYVKIGFQDDLAHMIYAGSDIFLMPSRYEPCGLGQLISMRYGTIPVARKTGGIVDTVSDYDHMTGRGTGFLFSDYSASALQECIKRALSVYVDRNRWKKMVLAVMRMDFSWKNSAKKYIEFYESIIRGIT